MFRFRRVATATLIAAGLVAGGAALAQAGTGAAAPLAAASQNVATGFLANGNGANGNGNNNGNGAYGHRGRGGPGGYGGYGGFGNGYGGFGGRQGRGGLVVTGVNGNSITATGRGSQAITVTVSATTAYTEAGQSASLSDVTPGVDIAVQGTRASNTAITATAVYIILPSEAGVVTAVNGSTLTITGFDGATRTINVTDSTRYQSAGQTSGIGLSNIATGTAIVAQGTIDTNGALTAKVVTIQVPRIGGQVTAVNGASYTVSGRNGATYTVITTGSTTYVNPNGSSAATTPTIAKGAFIMAEGTLSADGKTLTAQRILVLPTGMGNGFGRHGGDGGDGFGGQGFGGQSSGAATPGSTSTSTSTSSI